MTAEIQNRHGSEPVEALVPRLRRAAEAVLAAEGASDLDVSVAVVSDAEIQALSRDHLGHDHATDVLSFPLREEGDPDPLLGEVVVSADRAHEESAARGLPFGEELCRYVVHGVLHLVGYDDTTDELGEAMHARQEELLAAVLETEPS